MKRTTQKWVGGATALALSLSMVAGGVAPVFATDIDPILAAEEEPAAKTQVMIKTSDISGYTNATKEYNGSSSSQLQVRHRYPYDRFPYYQYRENVPVYLVDEGGAPGDAVSGLVAVVEDGTPTYDDENAGSNKTITYKLVLSGNNADQYELINPIQTTTGTINTRTVTLSWDNTALTYNGQEQKPTATVSNIVEGDECEVVVTGGQTNARTNAYTATASSLSNPNYALPTSASQRRMSFTISPKDVTIAWSNYEGFEYNGSAQYPTATLTGGLIEGDACNITVGAQQNDRPVTPANAGDYTATATCSNSNYTAAASTQDYNIAQKTMAIKGLTVANKIYDGTTDVKSIVTTGVTYNGVVEGETPSIANTDPTKALFANKDVGTQAVSFEDGVITFRTSGQFNPNNYKIESIEGSEAAITQRSVIVKGVTAKDKVYDGTTTAELDYSAASISGAVGEEKVILDDTVTGEFADKSVGNRNVTFALKLAEDNEVNKNYKLDRSSVSSNTAAITVRPLGLVWDENPTYNGQEQTVEAKLSGVVEGDAVELDVNYRDNAQTDHSPEGYTATISTKTEGQWLTGDDAGNYFLAEDATAGHAWNIEQVDLAQATVTLNPTSYRYDGTAKEPEITVTIGDLTPVRDKDYTVKYADNTNVGTAKVTITATAPGTVEPTSVEAELRGGGVYNYKNSQTVTFAIAGSVSYTAHVQTYGDEPVVADGDTAGTTGEGKRLEAISAKVEGGSIQYRSHVQGKGWETSWAQDGDLSGTTGEAKRIEAIQMTLSGDVATSCSVWYRVHSQTYGWLGWARNGQAAGTTGLAKRAEAYEVQVLPNGETPKDYNVSKPSYIGATSGNTHVQGIGWQGMANRLEFGTTGQSKRIEAVMLELSGAPESGGIQYQVHEQGKGWTDVKANGDLAGTTGEARRIEAVRISLTGDMKTNYSVWYRVHSQSYGWLGWTCDDKDAGTTGLGKRAEAVDIMILPKGAKPSGNSAQAAFKTK